jgi:ubiquinone/menaquinone biosynthesis C-methylase UbiE|tara:strand:- start:2010 stop:2633 length:624 start_codon:yes stop_codon:yes gene_type:complete
MRNKPSLQNAYDLKSPDDNIKLYSVWAETYDISFIDDMQYELHFAVAEEFVLNGGKGLILDVGAGTGAVAEALLQKAKFCIEATDISEEMLKVADSKNIYKRSFFSDLTKEIPVTNSSYDGVVSSGTFTHGHVGPSSISELVRITKPGGLITISINEKHWISLNFESEVEKLNQYTRNYTLKKISIYGEQSMHDHKDDKAVILTIKV